MRWPPTIPAGVVSDDTSHTAAGRWADASNVRFRLGSPETIGGYETLIADLLGGVCRSVFPWMDNEAQNNIAFGTHATLELFQGGELFDITPTKALPPKTLTDPFTVSDGSAVVTVAAPGHGLATGDGIAVSSAGFVGRLNPNGGFTVTKINDDSYSYTAGGAADLSKTLGSSPLATVSGSPIVTVTEAAHQIADGTLVTISGASAVNGITPNGSFAITVIDANSYKYTFTSNASGTGSGGGSSVVVVVPSTGGVQAQIAPQVAFAAGPVDGAGGAGYGTGAYGIGGYGEPSTADAFPRTWSLSSYGQNLIANPRGGAIYAWTNDTSVVAAPLPNSPRQVTYTLVTAQDVVMALGCNEESSGDFNHRTIRHCGIRQNTVWNTASDTTAREYTLSSGGRIVAGRNIGAYVLVWTTDGLYLGSYVGSLEQPYRFDKVGDKCGLIGPNAAVVVGGSTAFWTSPDRQFYSYSLGGSVTPVPCPIRTDFAEHLAASQGDKIVASSVAEHEEVWFWYPDDRDGEGLENSRAVFLKVSGPDARAWSKSLLPRTAMVDAGPTAYPVGVTAAGNIYYHEKGETADGSTLPNFITSADLLMSEDSSMMVTEMRPDFQGQQGPVTTTITTRFEPQGTQRTNGPYVASPGQRKVDMRASGRYAALNYASDYRFRVGNNVFDVKRAGNR